jgi:hypothetical protein
MRVRNSLIARAVVVDPRAGPPPLLVRVPMLRTLLFAGAAFRKMMTVSRPVVCSDETSARESGKTWREWVFVGTQAVLHVIRPSRGKAVVADLFGAVQPAM